MAFTIKTKKVDLKKMKTPKMMGNKTSTPMVSKKAAKGVKISKRATPSEMGLDMKRKFPKKSEYGY